MRRKTINDCYKIAKSKHGICNYKEKITETYAREKLVKIGAINAI